MEKIALVTGSEGGIGSAITSQLVLDGFRVIAAYYTGCRDIAIELFNKNGFTEKQVRLFEIDVTNTLECSEKLEALLNEEGHIDVIVNNAGITRDGMFKKMPAEDWMDVINTNLNSVFNVSRPLFGAMCQNKFGRIVNISSVNGLKGQFGQTNYSAAKAGMIGFSKALAAEGARDGVTVNVIAPGYTGTPMVEKMKPEVLDSIVQQVPMKRLAKPEEIAKAISFLVSEDAGYITGATLSVNGGLYMC